MNIAERCLVTVIIVSAAVYFVCCIYDRPNNTIAVAVCGVLSAFWLGISVVWLILEIVWVRL